MMNQGQGYPLRMALNSAGHQAQIAKDVEEALNLIERTSVPFDLVITDHRMPGLSGVDLVKMMKAKAYTGEIFVMSADVDDVAKEEYRNLGVAGIMFKPFDIMDLLQWAHCIQGCVNDCQKWRNHHVRLKQRISVG